MVGERGFEPPTPWSRNRNRIAISLVRLGWCCVVVCLIAGCLGSIGPNLDPSCTCRTRKCISITLYTLEKGCARNCAEYRVRPGGGGRCHRGHTSRCDLAA